jgi:protein-tyrosine phosphatase
MMQPTLFWIATGQAGRIAMMTRPRGGDWLADELSALRTFGVDVLTCLLTPAELEEIELADEERLARATGLEFHAFPIADYRVPALDAATLAFVARLAQGVRAGQSIAVHCRMGIGRSSLIVASMLGLLGTPVDEAFARIAAARGRPVPDTAAQRQWVDHLMAAQVWLAPEPAEDTL